MLDLPRQQRIQGKSTRLFSPAHDLLCSLASHSRDPRIRELVSGGKQDVQYAHVATTQMIQGLYSFLLSPVQGNPDVLAHLRRVKRCEASQACQTNSRGPVTPGDTAIERL